MERPSLPFGQRLYRWLGRSIARSTNQQGTEPCLVKEAYRSVPSSSNPASALGLRLITRWSPQVNEAWFDRFG